MPLRAAAPLAPYLYATALKPVTLNPNPRRRRLVNYIGLLAIILVIELFEDGNTLQVTTYCFHVWSPFSVTLLGYILVKRSPFRES